MSIRLIHGILLIAFVGSSHRIQLIRSVRSNSLVPSNHLIGSIGSIPSIRRNNLSDQTHRIPRIRFVEFNLSNPMDPMCLANHTNELDKLGQINPMSWVQRIWWIDPPDRMSLIWRIRWDESDRSNKLIQQIRWD